MSRADRAQLRLLLAAVPVHAGADDPALIALLEAWEAAGVRVTIQACRTRQGWLVGDVAQILATIDAETDL
jgi:hypothetical protein